VGCREPSEGRRKKVGHLTGLAIAKAAVRAASAGLRIHVSSVRRDFVPVAAALSASSATIKARAIHCLCARLDGRAVS